MDDDNPSRPWLPTLSRYMRPGELADFLEMAGLGPEEAAQWADSYIGPNETARAIREGHTIDEFLELRRERLGRRPSSPVRSEPVRDEPVRRKRVRDEWKLLGFTRTTAAPWRAIGVSAQDAQRWRDAGVTPADMNAWTSPTLRRYRFSLDEALKWHLA